MTVGGMGFIPERLLMMMMIYIYIYLPAVVREVIYIYIGLELSGNPPLRFRSRTQPNLATKNIA